MKSIKIKKIVFSGFILLLFASIIMLSTNVFATTSIDNFKIGEDGVATWDPFPNAYEYLLVINTKGQRITVPYYNVKQYMDLREFEEGEYIIKVIARNENKTNICDYTSTMYNYRKSDTRTLTFFPNPGTPVPEQNVKVGECGIRPINPTRIGYIFDNWYTEDLSSLYDFNTPITSDTRIVAKWNENIKQLDIHSTMNFVANGELPSFGVATRTSRVYFAKYGQGTSWASNKTGKKADWFGLSEENPIANDNNAHYGLKIKVTTDHNYSFDDNFTIIFNEKDITNDPLTYFVKTDFGGYLYVDLGTLESNDHSGILGDVDKDGFVNSTDAAILLDKYKSGLGKGDSMSTFDINKDGVINATDAAMVLDFFKNN